MIKGIIKNKVKKPMCMMLHGCEGVGKSTFAANSEKPIFIGGEENDELEVDRFSDIKKYQDVLDALKLLLNEDHDYKTVVIDTIDSVEELLHGEISGNDLMATACGGFGKSFEKAKDKLIELRDCYLKPLRDKGIQIILLAHSSKVKFEDPMSNLTYDTYEIKLHRKARPIFFEWCSAICFANFKTITTDGDGKKKYVVGNNKRVLYTEKRPAFEAKNRFCLPPIMPLDFKVFKQAVEDHYGNNIKGIIAEIMQIVKENNDKLPAQEILKSIEKNEKNQIELERILTKTRRLL